MNANLKERGDGIVYMLYECTTAGCMSGQKSRTGRELPSFELSPVPFKDIYNAPRTIECPTCKGIMVRRAQYHSL